MTAATHARRGPLRRPLLALIALLTVLGLLAACTSNGESSSDGADGTDAAPTTPANPDAEAIATAQLQVAQYDYDGALATLANVSTPEGQAELGKAQQAKAQAVQWPDNTTIPHIFYHSLIVDPNRAFVDNSQGVGFSQYMVTIDEFKAQLQQIYDNGWVLIHPQRIAAPGPDGTMTPTPIVLPPGKKPFVLSVDDVNYYEYMEGSGFATNLVVEDGKVVNTYTDAAGVTTTGAYDIVPIVDEFIEEHPDFSYQGDKGTLAITGYNGVLGYRSSVESYGDTPESQQAAADATVVADALKASGWMFASHSWGHLNMTKAGIGWITEDSTKWDDEVRPILGDTPLMIYPFGADISGVPAYTDANAKFGYLHGTGKFEYYFNVDGTSPYWVQIGPNYVRQARINIDGLSMQRVLDGKNSPLPEFFDVASTIDPLRPMPVPSVGGPTAGGG